MSGSQNQCVAAPPLTPRCARSELPWEFDPEEFIEAQSRAGAEARRR
jgi:hypothetical protein